MIFWGKNKKSILICLLLSVGFFLASVLISYFHNRNNDPQKIKFRFTSEIAKIDRDITEDFEGIKSIIRGKPFHNFGAVINYHQKEFSKDGTLFLIYENRKLKIWTNNSFQAPVNFSEEFFISPILVNGNGYYYQKWIKESDIIIVGLQLVKNKYKFTNDYLPGGFSGKFDIPAQTQLSLSPGSYNILDPKGRFLFSISFDGTGRPGILLMFILFFIYITSFLFLASAIFRTYLYLASKFLNRWVLLLAFVADIIILRAALFYFKFPAFIYNTDLFSPVYFASSEILPSLGDFLFNSILAVQLAYYINRYFPIKRIKKPDSVWFGYIIVGVIDLIIAGLFELCESLINGLIINSNISFNFNQLQSLTPFSFAGLFIIVSIFFTFYLIIETLVQLNKKIIFNRLFTLFNGFVILCLYIALTTLRHSLDSILVVLLGILLVLFYSVKKQYVNYSLRSAVVILFIFVLAIVATYMLNSSTDEKEHEQRKVLATHLSDPRDQRAEFLFQSIKADISHDSLIRKMFNHKMKDSAIEFSITEYVEKKYFNGYWKKYDLLLTVCYSGKKLSIKPDNIVTDCDSYFTDHIKHDLKAVDTSGLYFLDRVVDITYYLGKITLNSDQSPNSQITNLYIEFSAKNPSKGLGYPELLMDKSLSGTEILPGYSYAYYYQGELVRNVGKYFYDIENVAYTKQGINSEFINLNGYSHLIHKIDSNSTLLISKERPGIADSIAPFSFLFIFLIFILLIVLVLSGNALSVRLIDISFRLRLQVFIISLILISSILIGGITIFYLRQLNYNKNKDIVSEKMNTILVELENRFGNSKAMVPDMKEDLEDQLINLSNENFTDINIYGMDGKMLASTRSQIFSEGLLSEEMDPLAFSKLSEERKSFFIHTERIGNYSFLSAYTPLRNYENKLIGYLNLPYFARQEDLRQEMSKLLATYANLYVLIIALAVVLALLISRYITRPLQLIRTQLGNVQLGKSNAKVKWKRADEIGDLVVQYNRMIDELSVSAELLARSERESAWREMARQVAHEIKNPLTPIKLSMQHLIKAWDEQAPDWEARLKRFSQTLIMQIETLSAIATEFSDFAQMPASNFKPVDIKSIIHHSVQLFKEQENVKFIYSQNLEEIIVQADENQMLRVFNNLIKNSIQAFPSDQKGEIRIEIENKETECMIRFYDNGSGIPTEQQKHIFSPNFTTKSAGMGLGLAMVKNIIDNTGGKIWFESQPGKGTVFFILLPLNASA